MKFTLRRQLKPPLLPVDKDALGYTVRFSRVKIGSVFKHDADWFIKRSEDSAVINGTFHERPFKPAYGVWVTSMDSVKPITSGKLEDI